MTAGVQSFDAGAAYLPAPPSNPSSQGKADGKGLGAHPGREASDFQSEMDLQQAAPEPKSAVRPEKSSAKNAGKKQNMRSDDGKEKVKDEAAPAPLAATPERVVEPQRTILPISFAPVQPDETTDDAAQANTSQGEATQEAAPQGGVSQNVVADEAPLLAVRNEVIPAKAEQNDERERNPSVPQQAPVEFPKLVGSDVTKASDDVPEREAAPESKDPQSAAAPVITIPVATNPIVTNPIAADQPAAQSQPQTYEIQPVLQPEQKVPELTPLEPAPAAATQKVDDAPSSSPAALAFAARLTALQQPNGPGPTTSTNPLRPVSGSDATVVTRVPVRYAATAQIIQRAEQKSEGDLESQVEPTKYAGSGFDRSARPDFVVPSSSATNDTAKSSQAQPTPDPLPTPRTERVIEPPAAPPTSSRDIRVQVPDNNGGTTQVRFLETGGEVRVSVRTADTGLAQSLRSHLNDLSLRLAEGGVPAEIWKPAPSAASSQNDQQQPDREGRGSEGRHSGSHSGGHAGTQGDQQDQQERPAWLEEMEASLLARK